METEKVCPVWTVAGVVAEASAHRKSPGTAPFWASCAVPSIARNK